MANKSKYFFHFFLFTENMKQVDAVLGDSAELPCDVQNIKNSTEWPILIIWYKGQDYPIYRYAIINFNKSNIY